MLSGPQYGLDAGLSQGAQVWAQISFQWNHQKDTDSQVIVTHIGVP